jgi:non-ribosomal peptide synthetase component F
MEEETRCLWANPGIRCVIFGGEALKPGKIKPWKEKYPKTQFINMYGITETTVHVTYKEITAAEIEMNSACIGKPIPTLNTYVMDRYQRLLPIGIAGEICVGGEGVGRGYVNRPELAAEKFIKHP